MEVDFILLDSNKKGRHVVQDSSGYQYRFRSQHPNGEKVYYKCRARDKFGCKATGLLTNMTSFKTSGDHNHNTERAKLAVKEVVMNNVEVASKYGEAPPRNICANILKDCTNMGNFATGFLPNKHALNQKVARARKKLSQEPPLPRDLVTDLELLDDQFVYINKGERFLLCNEIVGEEGRILVFMSKDGKQVLEESTEWSADGTFEKCPPGFSQIYIIGGFVDHNNGSGKIFRPAVFALLPRKNKTTYVKLLKAVGHEVKYQPAKLLMDLEKAMITAVEETMPDTSVLVCSFHWKQCILREVGLKGLKKLQNESTNFDTLVHLIYVLQFVPPAEVLRAWNAVIMDEFKNWKEEYPPQVKTFLDYIQRTYIGTKTREPYYKVESWSLFTRVLEGEKTTNNDMESFNRSFNLSGSRRPNIWQSIKAFQREERLAKQKTLELRRGDTVETNPGRKKYNLTKSEAMKEIVNNYDSEHIEEFFQLMINKV